MSKLATYEKFYSSKQVREAFPDVADMLAAAGYSSTFIDFEDTLLFTKRIYLLDKTGQFRRAYTIQIEVFDYRRYKGRIPFLYGLGFSTTIDSAGADQFCVSVGQNGVEGQVNISEAEDRFRRIFQGVGSPFYED
jgi:hypothetical protein